MRRRGIGRGETEDEKGEDKRRNRGLEGEEEGRRRWWSRRGVGRIKGEEGSS